MAAMEMKAELLLRFPGAEATVIGSVTFPMTMVTAGENLMDVSVDLSGLEKLTDLAEA